MKLITWDIAKNYVHDASGIKKPELFLWHLINGIYYPIV